jgi:hypothetical protein
MRFYLGTHQPGWLDWAGVPLFVSDVRLSDRKQLPIAAAPWALDSGGFSIISAGRQFDPPAVYAARVRRYQRHIGKLAWAAPQDWMCEPFIVAKTGLSVTEHQWRTIDNLFELRGIAPDLPFIPVLQGFEVDDYLTHVDFYRNVGVDLRNEPLVGVGSICRRQGETVAGEIFQALHNVGVTRLHGFGLKKRGLAKFGHLLDSADSMAWSFDARRRPRLADCLMHKNCANCPRYALRWRTQLLTEVAA